MSRGSFRRIDRVLQESGLASVEARWEPGITSRIRVIADPEVKTTVRGEEHPISGDELIVKPTGGATSNHAAQQQCEARDPRAHSQRGRPQPNSCGNKGK